MELRETVRFSDASYVDERARLSAIEAAADPRPVTRLSASRRSYGVA
jgi:hypothetical protein